MIAIFDAHNANVVVIWKLYLYILSLGFSGPKTRWPPLFKHKMNIFLPKITLICWFWDILLKVIQGHWLYFCLPTSLRSFWNQHDINRVHNGWDMCKNIAKKWMFSKYVTLFWPLTYFKFGQHDGGVQKCVGLFCSVILSPWSPQSPNK